MPSLSETHSSCCSHCCCAICPLGNGLKWDVNVFYFIISHLNAPEPTSQLNLKQIIIKWILSNMNITDRLSVTLWQLYLDFAMSGSDLPLLDFSFTSVPVFTSSLLLSFSQGSKYDLATSLPSPLNPFTMTHRPSSHRDRELEKGLDTFLWSYVAQPGMSKPNS